MTNPIETNGQTRTQQFKQKLEQRDDFAGQTYRTIRDNPKTSAAIATGVVAAAGAGAFLWNRKNQIGTATGHATTSEEMAREVSEMNDDAIASAKNRSDELTDRNIQTDSKVGSVAY